MRQGDKRVIQRTLDDINEDVLFLSVGHCSKDWTERHDLYLKHFWSEEPGVGLIPRDKIRAYVHRVGGNDDPSTGIAAARALFRGYSGFVHAGASAAIDMWSLEPPQFLLSGMKDHPLYEDHVFDAWNPFYRGLITCFFVAKVFEDEEVMADCYTATKAFEHKYREFIFPA